MKINVDINVTLAKEMTKSEIDLLLDRKCNSCDEYKQAIVSLFKSQTFDLESMLYDITEAKQIHIDLKKLEVTE